MWTEPSRFPSQSLLASCLASRKPGWQSSCELLQRLQRTLLICTPTHLPSRPCDFPSRCSLCLLWALSVFSTHFHYNFPHFPHRAALLSQGNFCARAQYPVTEAQDRMPRCWLQDQSNLEFCWDSDLLPPSLFSSLPFTSVQS